MLQIKCNYYVIFIFKSGSGLNKKTLTSALQRKMAFGIDIRHQGGLRIKPCRINTFENGVKAGMVGMFFLFSAAA